MNGHPQDGERDLDRSIARYVDRCRSRIPEFVECHFSLRQTWHLQRPTMGIDLLAAPFNSTCALPYMAVQKVAEGLERVGYLGPAQWTRRLPAGIKTGYQARIERLICSELLEWDREGSPAALPQGFLKELDRDLAGRLEREAASRPAGRRLGDLLRTFTSGRAVVSDVSGTLLTLGMGWMTLGNASSGLRGIAYGMARQNAHDRAASRFFLGRRAGNHFYNMFPPAVQESHVWMILALLVAVLTVAVTACTIASDPIRKALGLHRTRLEVLLDEIERELLVLAHRTVKTGNAPAFPVAQTRNVPHACR